MVSANPAKTLQSQMPPAEQKLKFTVDAALLRELGERLVGKAHIALAELVKNSYDADATEVIIRFAKDKIEIIDNGQGMNFAEFQNYWMRIGSPHKQEKTYSRKFKRPVTGSKGVGRLSVQFLASEMSLITSSDRLNELELSVDVDWRKAISAGDLTQAEAICLQRLREQAYPGGKPHGTKITLTSLQRSYHLTTRIDFKFQSRATTRS
jgi:HSP90 family molecular chaperone